MLLFEDIQKARKKSQYAIGKHPNSHKRKAKPEEPEKPKRTPEEEKRYQDLTAQAKWFIDTARPFKEAGEMDVVRDKMTYARDLIRQARRSDTPYIPDYKSKIKPKKLKADPKSEEVFEAAMPARRLTEKERAAISSYRLSSAVQNHVMRAGRGNENAGLRSKTYGHLDAQWKSGVARQILVMRKIVDEVAVPTSHDTTVYRSVSDGADLFAVAGHGGTAHYTARKSWREKLPKIVGKTFTDHGFVSTTASESQARNWAGAGKRNSPAVMLRIKAPKGTRGLYMKHVADESEVIVKKEWLLPPGTKFKVTGHSVDKNGVPTLDMEVVHGNR